MSIMSKGSKGRAKGAMEGAWWWDLTQGHPEGVVLLSNANLKKGRFCRGRGSKGA